MRLGIFWVWVFTVAIGAASGADSARWAIVPAATPYAQNAADLLTVELTQWAELQLVERAAIDRVLAELKLNAIGLVAADRAVEFGKLAAADVVVYLEALDKLQPPQNRVRAIETKTGVRLLDTAIPAKALAADVKALASELKRVKEKSRTPTDKRQYVAVLNVRSEESGSALQPLAAALTALVDCDLQDTPSVVVLEREQLQKLREEQQLTGLELELKSAVSLVELGLRRDDSGTDLAVSLSLVSLSGEPPRTERFIVHSSAIDDVRRAVADHLRRMLGDSSTQRPGRAADLAQEAKTFAERAKWLQNYRSDDAIALAEAALALQPVREYYRLAWQMHSNPFPGNLSKLGMERIRPSPPGEKRQAAIAQLTSLLEAARRMHELDRVQLDVPNPPFWPMSISVNRNPFYPHTPRIWAEAEPPEVARLRQEIDAMRWEKYKIVREALDKQRESPLPLLLQRLELSHYFAASPDELRRQTLAWQQELDAEFAREQEKWALNAPGVKRYNPQQVAGLRGENVAALLVVRRFLAGPSSGADDEPRNWTADQLAPLWTDLAAHEHLGVRAVGLAGLTDLPGERGRQATQDLLECLSRIPITDSLGFPPDALENLVIQRLTAGKLLSGEVERRLAAAEQGQDPRSLWSQRPKFSLLSQAAKREDYSRRAIKLLDGFAAASDAEKKSAAELRKSLVNSIRPEHLPLPADLRPQQPATGPWAEYRVTPLRLTPPPGAGIFLGAVLDREALAARRGDELLVFWFARPGLQEAWVGRTGLEGGAVREAGPSPYGGPIPNWMHPHKATTGGGSIFIDAGAPGFAMLQGGKSRLIGAVEGFPGKTLVDMEWLEDSLYVSLGSGLARFDPERGTFRTLASNLAVDGRGPLDGGSAYRILDLLADPERKQLWLAVEADARRTDQGIWRYTPATEHWERVFAVPSNLYLSNLWWSDGRIRFVSDFGWRELNPASGVIAQLAGYRPFPRSNLTRFSRYYQQSGDHIIGLAGELYAPDGQEWRFQLRTSWRSILAVPQGFLVYDPNDGPVLLKRGPAR